MLTTKVTHLRNLLFRQPDGVNCVVRRVYLVTLISLSQQISAVSGLWMLKPFCVHVGLFEIQTVIGVFTRLLGALDCKPHEMVLKN